MRHQTIQQPHERDAVDVPAVWPATTQLAPLPVTDQGDGHVHMSEDAAPDLPLAAGVFIVGIYCVLLLLLAIGTTGSGQSLMAIVVDAFFLCMFFTIPAAFLGLGNGGKPHPSLARFMEDGMETLTGHTSGTEALVQMLMVPVCLAFELVCIGITVAIVF